MNFTHFKKMLLASSLLVVLNFMFANASAHADQLSHTPFVTVMLKDFDAWDTDHNGVLSAEEIERVVVDPKVKGNDAAAAATLKLMLRNKKHPLPPLTKAYFTEYDVAAPVIASHRTPDADQPLDPITQTVDTIDSTSTTQPSARIRRLPADFDLYFEAGKQRIARGGPIRFTSRFILEDTRQGPLGDCFFVASISSLAFHDPSRFEKLIVLQPDGNYQVNLPNSPSITVPPPTDAELAISSTTQGDGIWLAIMEQAFGRYRSRAHGSTDDVEGTELLRAGGDSMPTIRALTGHEALRISFGKTVEYRQLHADKILPKLRTELVSALTDHRVITAGIAARNANPTTQPAAGTVPALPPNIASNHVYAVLNYDPATDVVEIWNPHGQHFDPKGAPGLTNGYPTDHGRFKLPLTEAFAFYSSFTFEQSTLIAAATKR